MKTKIENYINFDISDNDREQLLWQIERISDRLILDIEKHQNHTSFILEESVYGKSHLNSIENKKEFLLTQEIKNVMIVLERVKNLVAVNNTNDLTVLVYSSIISEILDLVSSLNEILNKGNFISGYGLIRNLKERILTLMIINEDKDLRSEIYHSYYQNFLRDFYGKETDGENGNWWFKQIDQYKNSGINGLMSDFGIKGYHFNSQYTHGNFGTHTETPFFSFPLVLGTYGIKKGEDQYLGLFFESYYPINLEIIALLIDALYSFSDKSLDEYREYLILIHNIAMIKARKHVGVCKYNK